MAHIPNALNLANAMYGRRAEEIAPALGAFSDCILIAGSRNAQRAFFPINFLIASFATEAVRRNLGIPGAYASLELDDLDFSGKGMWLVYKI